MRTVTFSDKKTAKMINGNFVSTWFNRNPHFHNCNFETEVKIVENSYEMFSTKNFCTFFLTPDKEVLHYFSGYMSPEFFRAEVRFVLDLAEAVLDENGKLRKGWSKSYRDMHRAHGKKHKDDVQIIQRIKRPRAGTPEYALFQKNQAGFRQRISYLTEGLHYLNSVHQSHEVFGRRKKLQPIEKVLLNYRGGNKFTEE